MRGSAMRICFFLGLWVASRAACLPDAVPVADRAFIKDDTGKDAEISLISFDWPSAEFVSALGKMMIEEALGFNAKIEEQRSSSNLPVVLALTGCDTVECTSQGPSSSHVAMETWLGSYGSDYYGFKDRHPDKAPEDLGSMGYLGEEAVFVSRTVVEAAYEDSGISLNWYRSYNSSRSSARRFFSSVLDLPIEEFKFCNDSTTMWVDPFYMNDYARWSGDVEGLSEVGDGAWHAQCHGFDRFWLSPACRHNVSECIPMISQEYGWLVDAFMHWSTAYAMPVAIGILDAKYETTSASAEYFYAMARNFNVLSHWFLPDTSQVAFDPLPIIFPVHRASEWAVGNKRTAATGTYIAKLVSLNLREQAFKVHSFLDNLKLELAEMQEYLAKKDVTNSWEDVACQWVTSNRDRWEAWVPKETSCIAGFGLVNAVGTSVGSREAATGCDLCKPGTASRAVVDEGGRTYTCESCTFGTYQELSGETLCLSCPAGRIAAEPGRSQCEACPPGSYANTSGAKSCQPCGNGDDSPTWTTSRSTEVRGSQQWIQVEAAVSEELCHCIPGWFLSEERCQECTEGASCPGSSQVEVLPGYFSFSNDPGSIYKCYGNTLACPGGGPGTCADGRDNSSVACSACMPGLHSTEEGCVPCQGQDFLVLVLVCLGILVVTGGSHALLLLTSGEKMQTGFVKVGIYMGQLAVSVQIIVVMRRMDIQWQEPFLSLMDAFSFLAIEELMQLNAVTCVTRFSPTWQFVLQTLVVPLAFMTGPVMVHLAYVCMAKRRRRGQPQGLRLHILGEMFGMMCLVFFIVLCTAVLEPFDCVNHPNLALTMRTATDVLCNFRGSHFSLSLVASFLTLLPIGFVSLCMWLVLIELPKRIHRMDLKFIRSCSFLLSRFRPGNQAFAIFLLVRNAVVALAPTLPSADASCFVVFAMLCSNLCLTAMFQPWLSTLATYVDMLGNFCFLIILLSGTFYVDNVTGPSGMIVCSVVFCFILLVFVALSAYTLLEQCLRKRLKHYHFFLSHHKRTSGSTARLMKLELQQRGFSVFLDTDDLSSLLDLFMTISQNVETLLVIASPNLVTRKWCIGEIVTAHLQKVKTVVLALPGFHFPDAMFIEAFDSMGPGDLKDLASHGLGKADIREALRKLADHKVVRLPLRFQASDVADMMQELCPTKTAFRKGSQAIHSLDGAASSCLILANHHDMEALSTAYVLRSWMFPQLLRKRIDGPLVLGPGERVAELGAASTKFVVVLCTKDCFEDPAMIQWMIQCYHFALRCRLLTVIADEEFYVPGAASDLEMLAQSPNVKAQNECLPEKAKACRYAEHLPDLEPLALLLTAAHPSVDLQKAVEHSSSLGRSNWAPVMEQQDVDALNEAMTEIAF